MSEERKKSRWPVLIWVAVAALTVKTFLPNVWKRAGEEMQPVYDGAHRVVDPAFDKNQDDGEGETFVSHPDQQTTTPEDEEYRFWEPVEGKP